MSKGVPDPLYMACVHGSVRGRGTRESISEERGVSVFLFILTDNNYRPAW